MQLLKAKNFLRNLRNHLSKYTFHICLGELKHLSTRTHLLFPSPPNSAIKLWPHHWVNPLMKLELSWANHFPNAHQKPNLQHSEHFEGHAGSQLNIIREKPTTNIIYNGKRLKSFTPLSGTRKVFSTIKLEKLD